MHVVSVVHVGTRGQVEKLCSVSSQQDNHHEVCIEEDVKLSANSWPKGPLSGPQGRSCGDPSQVFLVGSDKIFAVAAAQLSWEAGAPRRRFPTNHEDMHIGVPCSLPALHQHLHQHPEMQGSLVAGGFSIGDLQASVGRSSRSWSFPWWRKPASPWPWLPAIWTSYASTARFSSSVAQTRYSISRRTGY